MEVYKKTEELGYSQSQDWRELAVEYIQHESLTPLGANAFMLSVSNASRSLEQVSNASL